MNQTHSPSGQARMLLVVVFVALAWLGLWALAVLLMAALGIEPCLLC